MGNSPKGRLMVTPPISTSTNLPWVWRGGKYSPVPCTRDSAHKTFGPTDLTSTYSVCTWRVFGGLRHRTQAFRSGVRCTNHQTTHVPSPVSSHIIGREIKYVLKAMLSKVIRPSNVHVPYSLTSSDSPQFYSSKNPDTYVKQFCSSRRDITTTSKKAEVKYRDKKA
ncbi:hypothetical protein TNCV_2747481 [Trichonephila clavipes]|nr:hypothetical protein TNCV_2747481 [Trichonephila clavipes]